LRQALSWLEEARRFAAAGADALPESAFWTEEGKRALLQDAARFELAMLDAMQRAWQSLLDRRWPG
jgi:hypothetical protein